MAFLARQCRSKGRFLESVLRSGSLAERSFATADNAASVGESGDIVLEAFREQQQAYRAVLEGLKNVNVPLGLEPQAVKKFADEVEALKKKAGYPDQVELIDATLDHYFKTSGGDLHKFIHDSVAALNMGNKLAVDELVTELVSALDQAEASHGPVAESDAAFEAFQASVQKIKSSKNFGQSDSDAVTDSYAETLKTIRQQAEEEVDIAKRRDGLESLDVDIKSIKPSFA